ncbi:MAG: fumarylacetoacetate hydrolase family protein [Myxococcota bacterium]|nr:fumarylacetoacetate hydrolase family protein [Myxococcota bacterium]
MTATTPPATATPATKNEGLPRGGGLGPPLRRSCPARHLLRVARVRTPGGTRKATLDAEGRCALPPQLPISPRLEDPPLEAAFELRPGDLLAPVRPGKIVAVGRNYAAHAAELGNTVPSRPLLFLKAPSALIGPQENILLPPDSQRVEHEAELGVVIKSRCRHVAPEQALDFVAGYTVVNDVTARDLQRADTQFARGKGFDTFCPVGPWMETDLDPGDLRVSCVVLGDGGEEALRQDGRTSQMIFPVPVLIAAISRIMTLQPGDLIATGTPEGVGLLQAGDRVRVSVEGIGDLENPVMLEEGVPELAPPISQA